MPKPIYMTPEMIEESFNEVREDFEKQFVAAKEAAVSKKLANGSFSFKFPIKDYTWEDDSSKATLLITPEAFSKTMVTVLSTDKEVGWHGIIRRDSEDNSKFILEDILLYPQAVTGATIDADSVEYPKWAMDLPDEQFNNMRFHGHSHVNMATNPSSVDMNFRADLIGQYQHGFYVFMIINKKLSITCQIYDFDENNLYDTDEINIVIGDNIVEEIQESTKKMVTNKTFNSSKPAVYGSQHQTKTKGFDYGTFYDDDYWIGGYPRT